MAVDDLAEFEPEGWTGAIAKALKWTHGQARGCWAFSRVIGLHGCGGVLFAKLKDENDAIVAWVRTIPPVK